MIQEYKFETRDVVLPHQLMIILRRNGITYDCPALKNKNDREYSYMQRDLKKKQKNQTIIGLNHQ
jgi:hypothetical protein